MCQSLSQTQQSSQKITDLVKNFLSKTLTKHYRVVSSNTLYLGIGSKRKRIKVWPNLFFSGLTKPETGLTKPDFFDQITCISVLTKTLPHMNLGKKSFLTKSDRFGKTWLFLDQTWLFWPKNWLSVLTKTFTHKNLVKKLFWPNLTGLAKLVQVWSNKCQVWPNLSVLTKKVIFVLHRQGYNINSKNNGSK